MAEGKHFTAIIKDDKGFRVYLNPIDTIICQKSGNIKVSLEKIEKYSKAGKLSCGFLSYEAGIYLNSIEQFDDEYAFPLVHFGVFGSYKRAETIYDIWKIKEIRNKFTSPLHFKVDNLKTNESFLEYRRKVSTIRKMIKDGTFYQLNYSIKLDFDFSGNPLFLFLSLAESQDAKYSAFIHTGSSVIISLSPELFFEIRGNKITAKPMKGTIKRGSNASEDSANQKALAECAKNRAENLMIVDLLRNDLGKISKISSVSVDALFEIEEYPTLFQMTSSISSQLKPDIGLTNIIESLFPCGSVTGAPKIMAMIKIKVLENRHRKAFCGAIGYIDKNLDARFNVGIRTLIIEKHADEKMHGEISIGSGIVYDSKPLSEYRECLLKADFFTKRSFYLVETMLYKENKKEIAYFDLHIKRFRASAKKLKFKCNAQKIAQDIKTRTSALKTDVKIRLKLYKNGSYEIMTSYTDDGPQASAKITISGVAIPKDNPFLYHKTSIRQLYDLELCYAKSCGFYDVIFRNTKGEITEGAFNNIFIEDNDGLLFTPPVSSGLLNGVLREHFIKNRKAFEKIIFEKDLLDAKNIYLGNSVRGLVKVDFAN